MPLPINPIDLIRLFRERGIRERSLVVDYLEAISTAATDMVGCWLEVYQRLEGLEDALVRTNGKAEISKGHVINAARQLGYFLELSAHYKRASSALRGKLNETEMVELFDALGSLLHTRNQTKALYELEIECERDLSSDEPFNLKDLKSMINGMQEEAATLRALVAALRVRS